MSNLQKYLHEYINDPLDFEINAKLGEEYEKQGQGAAALSYFLRAAELSNKIDNTFSYCCLLKTWKQVNSIGRRKKWEKSQLELAITHLPNRPEAYLFLSEWYSKNKEDHTAYLYACLGLKYIKSEPLRYDVGYPGDFLLYFLKAYHGWHISKREESKQIWKILGEMPNIPRKYKEIIDHNNKNFGNKPKLPQSIEFTVETSSQANHTKYFINK